MAGLSTIVLFVRDLWWVGADVTNTCNVTPNNYALLQGLPTARTKRRNKLCPFNSRQVIRVCIPGSERFLTFWCYRRGFPAVAPWEVRRMEATTAMKVQQSDIELSQSVTVTN